MTSVLLPALCPHSTGKQTCSRRTSATGRTSAYPADQWASACRGIVGWKTSECRQSCSRTQALSEQGAQQSVQEPDIRTVLEQVRNSQSNEAENRYRSGSEYLRSLGFNSSADILRILDVAMNPNSLYSPYVDKRRSFNSSARPLSVEEDMRPVVEFLVSSGMSKQSIKQVISEHPPVLCYSLEGRLRPLFDYLREIGIEQPGKTIQTRPTLLGLEADKNLRKIVDYLQHNEYSQEDIVTYMETSL